MSSRTSREGVLPMCSGAARKSAYLLAGRKGKGAVPGWLTGLGEEAQGERGVQEEEGDAASVSEREERARQSVARSNLVRSCSLDPHCRPACAGALVVSCSLTSPGGWRGRRGRPWRPVLWACGKGGRVLWVRKGVAVWEGESVLSAVWGCCVMRQPFFASHPPIFHL